MWGKVDGAIPNRPSQGPLYCTIPRLHAVHDCAQIIYLDLLNIVHFKQVPSRTDEGLDLTNHSMASLPPQSTASRGRSSHSEQSPGSSSSAESHSLFPSYSSSDRQSLTDSSISMNMPTGEETFSEHSAQPAAQDNASTNEQTTASHATPLDEPRHCWICLADEDDGSEQSNEWRSPCPCNLVAHEECLLEWNADQEATAPNTTALGTKLLCPQCKAEIRIVVPRLDPVVVVTHYIQKAVYTLIIPTAVSTVVGCVYSGAFMYGTNAIYLVFGSAEARRLLSPSIQDLAVQRVMDTNRASVIHRHILKMINPFIPYEAINWKLLLGLPAILPALVLSQTPIADQVFALLPITVSYLELFWKASVGCYHSLVYLVFF